MFAGDTRIVTKLEMSPTGEGNGPDLGIAPGDGSAGNGNGNGRGNGQGNGNGNGGNSGGGNGNGNGGGNQPGGYERFQYFYHPDHLGSTSFITDADGEVYQHLLYFPFGETWVNEVTNDRDLPYRFTGKELDEVRGISGRRSRSPPARALLLRGPLLRPEGQPVDHDRSGAGGVPAEHGQGGEREAEGRMGSCVP